MGAPPPPAPKPKVSRAQWAETLLAAAKIAKPMGPGPFPLVMHFHGCGGLRPFEAKYAERAVASGYAVVTVDSFKPRGISRLGATLTVCTGLQLHGAARAADLYALYDWARRQDWVDPRRIVAAGWSHGSWTIMDALAMGAKAPGYVQLNDLPARPLEGLSGVVLCYPYAAFPSWTRRTGWGVEKPPVYAVLGGRDQVVGTQLPQEAMARLERDGVKVQRLELPDATHAFDDQGASDPRSVYREDLTQQAIAWYAAALSTIAAR